MRLYKKQAMSLVELMTVIAIASILAIAAVPAYKRYLIKSRFSEVLVLLGSYRDDLGVLYADFDEFPQNLQNLTDGTYLASSATKWVTGFKYDRYRSNQVGRITISVGDVGLKDWVAANDSGTGGKFNRVTLVAVPTATGHMRFYCGSWDQGAEDVPLDYLPQSCQDQSLSALTQ